MAASAWLVAVHGAHAASQWVVMVLLMRLGGEEVLGDFALGVSIATPVILFANLGLRQLVAIDAGRAIPLATAIRARGVTAALAWLGIAGGTLLAADWGSSSQAIMAVAVAKTVDSVADLFFGFHQRRGEAVSAGMSLLFRSLTGATGVCLALLVMPRASAAAVGLSVGTIVVLLAYDLPRIVKGDRRGERVAPPIARLLRDGLRVSLYVSLASLTVHIPRYFVSSMMGTKELGVLAAVTSFAAAAGLLGAAVGHVYLPRMAAACHRGGTADLLRLTKQYAATVGVAGLLLAALAVVYGSRVLDVTFGIASSEEARLLVWTMVSACVVGQVGVVAHLAMAAGLHASNLMAAACGALTCAVVAWLCTPSFGLFAAPLASAGSAVVVIVLVTVVVRRYLFASELPPDAGLASTGRP
jgi:O-antigen/teichoic acid export membrane protein